MFRYKNPEDARKAVQTFNSKRFCDFPYHDFIKKNYIRHQGEYSGATIPEAFTKFLNTDEYFNQFELKVEKLSEKDFNSFMRYRDFELVMANSRGQLGKIFGLPDDSPIFQPGPHWKNLSLDRDPYRTDIYRENQFLYFNRDLTFKQRDGMQDNRFGGFKLTLRNSYYVLHIFYFGGLKFFQEKSP